MSAGAQQSKHRPGALKQQNKSHKHGKHKSKGSIDNEHGGRISGSTVRGKKHFVVSRADRKNQLHQLRSQKRLSVVEKKRAVGHADGAPFLVSLVALSADVDPAELLELVKRCDDGLDISCSDMGIVHIWFPRFKTRYAFHVPSRGDVTSVLDSAKASDVVLFLLSADGGIDSAGSALLSMLMAQGLPSPMFVVQGLTGLRKPAEWKRNLQRLIDDRVPDARLLCVDSTQDAVLLLRRIREQHLTELSVRQVRPYLMADRVQFDAESEQSVSGTLRVSGWLRGKRLSANQLVHVVGCGDFSILRIEDGQGRLLQEADPSEQVSLQAEANVDGMDAEQTWPTEEELQEAMEEQPRRRKVPKGTSAYQAAWLDEDEEAQSGEEAGTRSEEDDEEELVSLEDEQKEKDEDDDEESAEQRERDELLFPDEVDTPRGVAARVRFQKYRGLKSFAHTPWDPMESLPSDYARIFRFANFERARKQAFHWQPEQGAEPGWLVTVWLRDVPRHWMDSYRPGRPLVVCGLLPHEQQMSVVHAVLHKGSDQPLASKTPLVLQCGFRRFRCRPIFSEHYRGNKQKWLRFFPPEGVCVASTYAPILFPPAPVLAFKELSDGSLELVATGSLLSVSPDRVIVKRTLLSGIPAKMRGKTVVVRQMFYNREDVDWFTPVELRTKHGRKGHIKEALGTHGAIKCLFDRPLQSQDTVLMPLYKRIFPPWSYEQHTGPAPLENMMAQ